MLTGGDGNDTLSLPAYQLGSKNTGGSVNIAAAAKSDLCILTVEDSGPGISLEARAKLLQPFFTTKTQGTGLGLAIVARRVAEFGGKLEWESPVSDGRGTRFQVTLPIEGTLRDAIKQTK